MQNPGFVDEVLASGNQKPVRQPETLEIVRDAMHI